MNKNSKKLLKILALLLCEANNIGGIKSSANENRNLQLATQSSKNTSKASTEIKNWIKQNPIKSLLIGGVPIVALLTIGGILVHNCFVNNKKDTEYNEALEVFNKYDNKWEALCKLLGKNGAEFVKNNYSEWKERINGGRDRFALMSIYHSLKLAAEENYNHFDKGNNELLIGDLDKIILDKNKYTTEQRLGKVIVEDEDILRSAHKFLLEHPDYLNVKIGFLNAGSPYAPNGYIEYDGGALEEYLSTHTTLIRDLSGKAFRTEDWKQGFYTTEKDFPGICPPSEGLPGIEVIRERLMGKGRDFYHQRGIMSHNVRLTRSLGDINKYYRTDKTFPWNSRHSVFTEFEPPKDGLGKTTFSVLTIIGLEDRSKQILNRMGKEPISEDNNTPTVYQTWEKITKTQCEFVLKAFIKEKVKVPFLCAFSAGAFGGKASMVAKCFKELLIDKGYIDYFDYVVFPIGYSEANFKAFKNEFSKK